MRVVRTALLVLAAVSVGVAADDTAAEQASQESELESASRILEQVRKLQFLEPVQENRLTEDELGAELNRMLDEETSAEEEQEIVKLLARLQLIPENYPLKTRMLETLTYQVAGFYDPKTKKMVTVEMQPREDDPVLLGVDREALDRIVLIHELDHALNDQHFDLEGLIDPTADPSREDRVVARHALAEGDAMLAMMLAQMQILGAEMTREQFPIDAMAEALESMATTELVPGAEDIPQFLKDQIVQPYVLGFEYVARTWKEGDWAAVDALWSSPPDSTEQVLHPDRADDPPQVIILPRKDRRARPVYDIEVGELGMRTWLQVHVDAGLAEQAAAGWDGDRVGLYRRKRNQNEHVVWDSVWDSATDAEEFAEAARQWFAQAETDGEVEREDARVRLRF